MAAMHGPHHVAQEFWAHNLALKHARLLWFHQALAAEPLIPMPEVGHQL